MKFGIQKTVLLFACAAALMFTACDSDSSSANNQVYSSDTDEVLSSGGDEIVSSSSDASVSLSSSSSDDYWSSSSGEVTSSSSSVKVISPSSSSLGKANWAYLNPNISYGEFTDDRDGQVYKTVKIGTQTWMAENLNYADSIVSPVLENNNSRCFKDSADNCTKYGRLYTWAAAIDSVSLYNDKGIDCGYGKTCILPDTVYGICPEGWHLPMPEEWSTLYIFVQSDKNLGLKTVGNYLKTQGWWESSSSAPLGSDTYGFSALQAGYRDLGGDFRSLSTLFWSAAATDSSRGFYRALDFSDTDFFYGGINKLDALSVRCLKD